MIQIQKAYEPIYQNKDKFITILSGGRGSAKSFNASTFIERLTFERGHKILYSRYTMTSAQISVIPEFIEKIEKDGTGKYFAVRKSDIINTRTGSEILFRGIKTSSGNQTANLKSIQGITTFVGDEMEEWLSEDDFDKLVLSIRQKGIQLRIILILNPCDEEHFIYQKYIKDTHKLEVIDGVEVQISTHPDVLHIHTTYLDNKENLSEQFINEVTKIKKESLEQVERELIPHLHESESKINTIRQNLFNKTKYALKIVGRWAGIAEGVIFNNWRIGEFDTSLPYGYGQDYGFSIDPDTLIKVAVDRKRKRIYVDEKYYASKQLSTSNLINLNKKLIDKPNDLIVGDSAELRLISDMRDSGLNIIGCYKAPDIVTATITEMLDYEIIVTENSKNVINELKKYSWNNKKAGIPQDAYNHAIDSIRYIYYELVNTPNNDLKAISSML